MVKLSLRLFRSLLELTSGIISKLSSWLGGVDGGVTNESSTRRNIQKKRKKGNSGNENKRQEN